MQREIKFRGKRVDNGEWVYGLPVNYCNKTYILILTNFEEERVHEQYPHKEMWPYEVILETVGQYTGLKDKKGKEIYEGDIIEYVYREHVEIYRAPIKYESDRFIADWINNSVLKKDVHFWTTERKIQVIGNIHNNPEML